MIFSPSNLFFFLKFKSSIRSKQNIQTSEVFKSRSLLVFLSFKCSILSLFLFFKLLITGSISSFGDWAAGNRWTEIAMRMIMTNSVLKSTTVSIYLTFVKKHEGKYKPRFDSASQNQYQPVHKLTYLKLCIRIYTN